MRQLCGRLFLLGKVRHSVWEGFSCWKRSATVCGKVFPVGKGPPQCVGRFFLLGKVRHSVWEGFSCGKRSATVCGKVFLVGKDQVILR